MIVPLRRGSHAGIAAIWRRLLARSATAAARPFPGSVVDEVVRRAAADPLDAADLGELLPLLPEDFTAEQSAAVREFLQAMHQRLKPQPSARR